MLTYVRFRTFLIEADISVFVLIALFGFPLFVFGPPVLSGMAPGKSGESTKVVFLGDIMLDRQIRIRAETYGYDFLIQKVKSTWAGADAVVANLEGPVTSNPSISMNSIPGSAANYSFTFAPESAGFLAQSGIKYVSIGNNHILNQGWDGVRETERNLAVHGVNFFGSPGSNPHRTAYFEKNGIKIAFVAYNEFWKGDEEPAIRAVSAAKKISDFVVVYSHWGNEYENEPRNDQRVLARRFVDAGADMVLGSHPHVIQSSEVYAGAPIYYSLGNFIFDQYFEPRVMCGEILSVTFSKEPRNITVKESSVTLDRSGETIAKECRSYILKGSS